MKEDELLEINANVDVSADVDVDADVLAEDLHGPDFAGGDPDDLERTQDIDYEIVFGLEKRAAATPFTHVPESLIRVYKDESGMVKADVLGGEWGVGDAGEILGQEKLRALKAISTEITEWCRQNRVFMVDRFIGAFPRIHHDEFCQKSGIKDSTLRDVKVNSAMEFDGRLICCTDLFA